MSAHLLVRFAPQTLSNLQRLYVGGLPPFLFVAAAMEVTVVDAAQRHCELIADLAPKRARLPKLDVMGIGRAPAADKARLRAHEVLDAALCGFGRLIASYPMGYVIYARSPADGDFRALVRGAARRPSAGTPFRRASIAWKSVIQATCAKLSALSFPQRGQALMVLIVNPLAAQHGRRTPKDQAAFIWELVAAQLTSAARRRCAGDGNLA